VLRGRALEIDDGGRVGRHRQLLAEDQDGVAELDDVAVGEHRALGGLAVDERAVLGLGVDEDPAPEAGLDAAVPRRHPAIGHLDGQLGAAALGATIGAATEDDRRDAAEIVTSRERARTRALDRQHQRGPLDGPVALARRVIGKAERGPQRVHHDVHLTQKPMAQPGSSRHVAGDEMEHQEPGPG
jgi:hypothetical protein